jgi:hypothetical protein
MKDKILTRHEFQMAMRNREWERIHAHDNAMRDRMAFLRRAIVLHATELANIASGQLKYEERDA